MNNYEAILISLFVVVFGFIWALVPFSDPKVVGQVVGVVLGLVAIVRFWPAMFGRR